MSVNIRHLHNVALGWSVIEITILGVISMWSVGSALSIVLNLIGRKILVQFYFSSKEPARLVRGHSGVRGLLPLCLGSSRERTQLGYRCREASCHRPGPRTTWCRWCCTFHHRTSRVRRSHLETKVEVGTKRNQGTAVTHLPKALQSIENIVLDNVVI